MGIEELKGRLPAYARDLKLNLGSVMSQPGLTVQQAWGTALASAVAAREPAVLAAIAAEAEAKLTPEAVSAAKAAAAIMGMNNVYYRFVHLVGRDDYATMPARLRMNVIADPGVDGVDFELWSLAVSAINGCGKCMESHEQVLARKGVPKETVQAAIRIAAVIHAVAVTMGAEALAPAA